MIKRLVSGVNAWQGEPVTRRADFNARHQAGVLNGLWLESGLDQTTAAANGGMSQSSFWRLIKGHQPLREDQYPSMARALSVSEADLRRALLGEADDDDEQAPPDWDLRAELAAILPDAGAVERAYRHCAGLTYEEQRDALTLYRVEHGIEEPDVRDYPLDAALPVVNNTR